MAGGNFECKARRVNRLFQQNELIRAGPPGILCELNVQGETSMNQQLNDFCSQIINETMITLLICPAQVGEQTSIELLCDLKKIRWSSVFHRA